LKGLDVDTYLSAQRQLNTALGFVNTLLLLTSSLFVVLALQAARAGRSGLAPGLFGAAALCGLGFLVVKVVEYREKATEGLSLLSNEFYMFYYVYTGIHLLHVLIGLGVLAFLLARSRKIVLGKRDIVLLESGACYWHLVDLLWIVLFPLLYLLR
jgi:nitric oxide reductase NorE protein